jgi:alpha-L-fucosidase
MRKINLTWQLSLIVLLSSSLVSCNNKTHPQAAKQNQLVPQSDETLKKKQEEFLKWKFGMFLHFNMSTFSGSEWSNGYEDTTLFRPSRLDCNQWLEAAKAAGMKYTVLTVKHTGGWCLWDSKYTRHDIARFSNYKNGKGDIVRDFVNACRTNDIKAGLYYCLPGNFSNRFGNKLECDQQDLHGLFPEATGDFEWYIEKQVEELLTNYGNIDLIWFDQYQNRYTGKYWQQLKSLVHRLQPECIVIANNSKKFEETDITGYEYPYLKEAFPGTELPPEGNLNASEVCDYLDERGWFWHPGSEKIQEVKDVFDRMKLCNSRKSNYLLNVPPDTSGLLPDAYVKTLRAIGENQKTTN